MPSQSLLTATLCVVAGTLQAADLRIETRVYQADSDQPFRESVTLFSDGVVYDFRPDESRTTIFRPGAGEKPGRFVLLDTARKVRTEIDADRVASAVDKLRDWASQQDDPFLNFTADPHFEERFDAETGDLRLVSDELSYRLVTIPTDHDDMRLPVRRFLDQFARLETLLDAGLPPEPRLRVNEALFRHKAMPVEVHVVRGPIGEDGGSEPDLWADHLTAWVLSKDDRRRIDDAIDRMASFEKVTNEAFQQGRTQTTSK